MIVGHVSFGRTFLGLWKPLAATFLWASAVTAAHTLLPNSPVWISPLAVTVVGAAVGVMLTFRNNVSYARHWEARSLWGALINNSRAFTRQLITYIRAEGDTADNADREKFIRETVLRTSAFSHALRHHLRREDPQLELRNLVGDTETERLVKYVNVPNAILLSLGQKISYARQRGWLDSITMASLDQTLTTLANIQGGCERILNTPLPPVYTHVAHRVVLAFCFLLPFGLVGDVGVMTPLVVMLIAFAFLILSSITLLLENPFGLRANDLSLTAMSRTIEIDLRQSINDVSIPEPVKPQDGVLL